ncbi:uncharacterized protein K452DRAFT_102434 [Neofusicoccum parvum]|uniref:Uncharacterized protein K452DRAFT_102434 n=1 Tax=Neofusicoccum parvum TaxID=310453 RepID=A0ACB5SJI8_9PEZI|nr:uncharacterized protein K452DRAFT_102434 [Neofusicoccum parvum]
MVLDGLDSNSIPITQTLKQALIPLARVSTTGHLWIDQLCIDQNDVKDKEQQVGMMGDIYKMCERCIVWLGMGDEGAKVPELMRHLQTESLKFPNLGPLESFFTTVSALRVANGGETALSYRRALDALFHRPWFSRGWVVQEYILPKCVVFLADEFSFDHVALDTALLAMSLCGNLTDYSAAAFMAAIDARKLYQRDNTSFGSFALCCLLEQGAGRFITTFPHDRLYAYLGLWRPHDFALEYGAPLATVLTSFAQQIAKSEGSLVFFGSSHGVNKPALPELSQLPSWVPDYITTRADTALALQNMRRSRLVWDASAGRPHIFADDNEARKPQQQLITRGRIIDHVRLLTPFRMPTLSMADGAGGGTHANDDILAAAACALAPTAAASTAPQTTSSGGNGGGSSTTHELDRVALFTFLRDAAHGGEPQETSSASCLACYELVYGRDKRHGAAGIETLLKDAPTAERVRWIETWGEVLDIFTCVRGRGFAKTVAGGAMALVPHDCREGDSIAVLHGSPVPVVLRKVGSSGCYQLVGDCYVEGVMNGEAVMWAERDADAIILM